MRTMFTLPLLLCLAALVFADATFAQSRRGAGPGFRGGRGLSQDEDHSSDHDTFHYLLDHHDQITRKVTNLPDGVETVTESQNPEVAAKIQEHTAAMYRRIDENQPVRMWDPLFREIFARTESLNLEIQDTGDGVRVIETSQDPYAVLLIQAHARAVTGFVNHGRQEAHKSHPVPEATAVAVNGGPSAGQQTVDQQPVDGDKTGGSDASKAEFAHPKIQEFGEVVQLPDAAEQPRGGSKLCIDVTSSAAAADQVNSGLQKVARFVNIYAGAGREAADAEFVVVLHGGATLVGLNQDAYRDRFDTDTNPNLPLIRQLKAAGVEFLVCGQSLAHNNASAAQLVPEVGLAVSALTANVNRQQDGWVRVPLD